MKSRFKIVRIFTVLVLVALAIATYMSVKKGSHTQESIVSVNLFTDRDVHTGNTTRYLSPLKSVSASEAQFSRPSTPPSTTPPPPSLIEHEDECSSVHVVMVATRSTEGISLYYTLKSVFMHRSVPIHFHFIVDKQTQTILQTMLDSWLLPGISHDYHLLDSLVIDSDENCGEVPSIFLNLQKIILPSDVKKVIAIEPTAVITVDLALLRLASELHKENNHSIVTCGTACGTYCPGRAEPPPISWGASVITLTPEKPPQCPPHPPSIDQIVLNTLEERNIKKLNDHVCEQIREFDGQSLRHREEKKCPDNMKPIVKQPPSIKDVCAEFKWERNVKRRELPHILGHYYEPKDKYDVTLSLQVSPSRLDILERILKHWDGPASVAFHMNDSDIRTVLEFLNKTESLRNRANVTYHLSFKVGIHYAFNVARELSHRFVITHYVYFLDVDFITSPHLYQNLREQLRSGFFGDTTKTAIIIPAFETFNNKSRIPSSKSEMVKCFNSRECVQFHGKGNPQGQRATNYNKWKGATEPYNIHWHGTYEPYPVLETSVFSFDGQFIARLWDKTVYFTELYMAGYKFIVSPDTYVLHFPHSKTHTDNMLYKYKCSMQWYRDWLVQKKKKYGYTRNDVY